MNGADEKLWVVGDLYQQTIATDLWHSSNMADLNDMWPDNLGYRKRPYPIYGCDIGK